MSTPATIQDRPKGVVAPAQARRMFRMERYLPAPELAAFLDHIWIVEWDLGTQPPYVQRTLPYPCVHPVFDAAHAGMAVRSLQQLFSDYVGVSPKWAIRRFRLHEAADRLAKGEEADLAALAQDLGYFDQAHFSSDFRRLVGEAPAHYRKRAREAAA